MKYGIAMRAVKKQKDKHFSTNPIPAFDIKEVPWKILLRHVLPTPMRASPANPKVQTPIIAALRFCLHLKYSAEGIKIRSSTGSLDGELYL